MSQQIALFEKPAKYTLKLKINIWEQNAKLHSPSGKITVSAPTRPM